MQIKKRACLNDKPTLRVISYGLCRLLLSARAVPPSFPRMIIYYTLLYDMSIGLIENSLKIFLGGSNNIFNIFVTEGLTL